MGIYTNRGFEYLVIFKINPDISIENLKLLIKAKFNGDFPKMTCVLPNTVSIICQDTTDDRLIKTQYYKDNKPTWFHNARVSYTKLPPELITDFEETDKEKELIEYINNLDILKSSIVDHGWYDVNHVSTTYDL
jgi:hypothetical protein